MCICCASGSGNGYNCASSLGDLESCISYVINNYGQGADALNGCCSQLVAPLDYCMGSLSVGDTPSYPNATAYYKFLLQSAGTLLDIDTTAVQTLCVSNGWTGFGACRVALPHAAYASVYPLFCGCLRAVSTLRFHIHHVFQRGLHCHAVLVQ